MSLKDIGLRIQLNHRIGERCVNPELPIDDDFVVIDINGIHSVGLDYCGCTTAIGRVNQVLQARWYPATTINPKTAVTFNALEYFQLLTFESKSSAFQYYNSLSRRTDNTGIVKVPVCNPSCTMPSALTDISWFQDRYPEFLRMVREWRHLKMLKRAARGHDPAGVQATQAGECAVLCPACPQPDKNLPVNWRDTPQGIQSVLSLYAIKTTKLIYIIKVPFPVVPWR